MLCCQQEHQGLEQAGLMVLRACESLDVCGCVRALYGRSGPCALTSHRHERLWHAFICVSSLLRLLKVPIRPILLHISYILWQLSYKNNNKENSDRKYCVGQSPLLL